MSSEWVVELGWVGVGLGWVVVQLINAFIYSFNLQTATSSLWLLYNLARHPAVQEKLHQEIHGLLGKDGEVSAGSLAKLSYLKACVKESAR